MDGCAEKIGYNVGVLVVSDTVSSGQNIDLSGSNLVKLLKREKYFPVNSIQEACVSDDLSKIQEMMKYWADQLNIDLILSVGGTGFSVRDVTPEATKGIIDREAPHLASHMVLGCCEKTPFAALSRSVCGMRGQSLILNLPGSQKGSQECFEQIGNVLSHALDQLKGNFKKVTKLHTELQGEEVNRAIVQDRTQSQQL